MTLLHMSFYGTVLIIIISLIRMIAINTLPKKTFLILWGIVLMRLLVPFTLPSSLSVYSLVDNSTLQELIPSESIPPTESLPNSNGQVFANPIPLIIDDNPQITANGIPEQLSANSIPNTKVQAVSPTPNKNSSPSILSIVWMIGTIGLAVFFILTYIKCKREFQMSFSVDNDFVTNWKIAHKLKRSVDIRQSSRIKAPLTYGVFRPVILLPKNTNWHDIDSLNYVLTHEYIHIRRFDALTKLILTAAFCVHWFNPLVWLMYILANKDIELSCDESVIRTLGEKTKSAYARTLITMEKTKSTLTPLCNNFSKNAIEERITAIMKIKKISLKKIILSGLLLASVTTLFVTTPEKLSASPAKEESAPDNRNYSQYINESFTSDISKIDIEIVNYYIFIEAHDSDEIIVVVDIENSVYKDPLTVELSGDTLEISQIQPKRNNSSWSSSFKDGSIVVKVPADSEYDYDINSASADIDIDTVTANNIDVGSGSGSIIAQKVSGDITFGTGSGSIDLSDVNSSGKNSIEVGTGSGSITAQKVSGDITFGTGSGNINLSDVNSSGTNNIEMGTGSGNMNLYDVNLPNSILTVGTGSGRKTLAAVTAKSIHVTTGSGRSNLEQITCTDITMEGSSGDIEFSDLNAQNITIDMVDQSSYGRGGGSSRVGNVRGSIIGTQSDFSVSTRTESGSINLRDQQGSGNKTLDIFTDSGDIDISFTE